MITRLGRFLLRSHELTGFLNSGQPIGGGRAEEVAPTLTHAFDEGYRLEFLDT